MGGDDARVESDTVLSAVTRSMDVSATFSAENTHTLYTSSIRVIVDHDKISSDCMIVTKLEMQQSRL